MKEISLITKNELTHVIQPLITEIQDLKLELQKRNKSYKYFRNKDLKENFGISPNTIIEYRDSGIIPYTYLGGIFLYPVDKIEKILLKNSVG